MKKTFFLSILTMALGLFLFSASASASPITIDTLQPASATTNFESIRVGVAGQGGVTFFNGSVLNESGPYVIADDLRIDGSIWRGPSKGTGDNQAIKIADSMHPALTAANDLGSSEFQWNNAYFAGDVQVGNLQGTNIIHENNISNNSITSSKIQNGTIQGEDLTNSYQTGSAYDSRFVNVDGDTMNGRLTVSGGATPVESNGVIISNNSSLNGRAVYGNSTGQGGIGVYGNATNDAGTGLYGNGSYRGVDARASATDGIGIYSRSTSSSGVNYGGYFQAAGGSTLTDKSAAVYGVATNTTSRNYGGYFEARGDYDVMQGRSAGVVGKATNSSTTGVFGIAEGTAGRGVYGHADNSNGIGVYGQATGTATTAGLFYGNVLMTNGYIKLDNTNAPVACTVSEEGAVYYDTDQNQPCFCDGTNWVEFDDATTICAP